MTKRCGFWEKVQKTDTCWLWIRCLTGKGYGCVSIGGRRFLAHRVAYEQLIGPIPDGLTLDHVVCQNKRCVNPAHVEPVTRSENSKRYHALTTTCRKGHLLTRKGRQRVCNPCENDARRAKRRQRRLALVRSDEALAA
jgi:hypothetical protein